MSENQIGLIGLAVMGQNLVRNLQRNGYTLSIYNRNEQKTKEFTTNYSNLSNITATFSIKELCISLAKPRKIILMIKAGTPVDNIISQLIPYLDEGDIIIDGGNSYFEDTNRRLKELKKKKIGYLGTGISGGEEGALNGPSIMPGGSEWAWDLMKSCLQKISAQIDGYPCCYYIGSDGAGHFVKMVHNGIEYAMMELIGETYALLQRLHNLNAKEIGDIYTKWNQGELNSYLLEITSKIFKVIDAKTQKPLVDIILDKAEHKGTGKWTSLTSLNLSEAIPTITQAVYQRFLSANKQIRIKASNILPKPSIDDEIKTDIQKWLNIETIRKALYLSIICCYAQGFSLIYSAGKEYSWKFNMKEIAKLWKGGCIIRAKLLKNIEEAFIKNPELENLLLSQSLTEFFSNYQDSWRETISCAVKIGVSIPAFTSSLSYYDGLRSENLPLNLIQAQRDFFGAHTFERIDDTGGKKFHYNWNEHDYEK